MKILSIETSCDDTSVALIEAKDKNRPCFKLLSNIVSSQVKIHKKYGGVYPSLAKREHQRNLLPVLIHALKQSKLLKISNSQFLISKQIPNSKFQILNSILEREPELLKKIIVFLRKYEKPKIDAIAITTGPGLEPCLWVGVNFAKALACFWDLPIIPVNHIEAHIFANWLSPIGKIKFPAVCLVVSGGHTQIILMSGFKKYTVLGETRDDAAGECFDKTARILGLGYPGGPVIAVKATEVIPPESSGGMTSVNLPRPMINTKDYDFSFSGLKTAVLYDFKSRPPSERKSRNYINQMCAEIQQAVIDVLIKKTLKAVRDFKAKTIILGGGVSANKELRKQFKSIVNHQLPIVQFFVPPQKLCTDNAAMVGVAGYFNYSDKRTKKWSKIKVEANSRVC